MIDFAASLPHFVDHLLPIWNALEPSERGTFWIDRRISRLSASIEGARVGNWVDGGPVVVASIKDYAAAPRRVVALVEHGAGQDYGDANPSNAGGRGRGRVGLFICPSESVARRNSDAWPDARTAVVGPCRLDRWLPAAPRVRKGAPLVVLSWHWEARIAPEARSAFPAYATFLPSLAAWARSAGITLAGHAHPRAWPRLRPAYEAAGIPIIPSFDEVLDRADVYVCDNSSTIYEAAAVGVPTVVINAPWYRRDANWGLRFWEHIPGPQVDERGQLIPSIEAVLADPAPVISSGLAVAEAVYVGLDGHASDRAAQALRSWVVSSPSPPFKERPVGNPYAPKRSARRRPRGDVTTGMPLKAAEVRDWIGTDPDRARAALDAEERAVADGTRKQLRATVTSAAQAVLGDG